MKQTVYIETTVISYLTSRPSRDLIVAAHQQITNDWWNGSATQFDLYISSVVLDEISQGDSDVAARRLATVAKLPLLERTPEVDELADYYARKLMIPDRALADCYHLALACWHDMDYLVSWNMAHIVNGVIIRQVQKLNAERGLATPVLCSPEELLEQP